LCFEVVFVVAVISGMQASLHELHELTELTELTSCSIVAVILRNGRKFEERKFCGRQEECCGDKTTVR